MRFKVRFKLQINLALIGLKGLTGSSWSNQLTGFVTWTSSSHHNLPLKHDSGVVSHPPDPVSPQGSGTTQESQLECAAAPKSKF